MSSLDPVSTAVKDKLTGSNDYRATIRITKLISLCFIVRRNATFNRGNEQTRIKTPNRDALRAFRTSFASVHFRFGNCSAIVRPFLMPQENVTFPLSRVLIDALDGLFSCQAANAFCVGVGRAFPISGFASSYRNVAAVGRGIAICTNMKSELVTKKNNSSSSSLAQLPMSVKACLYPLVGLAFSD